MDPAVKYLERDYSLGLHRPYGATGGTGVGWVRRLFEVLREAHEWDGDPLCTCYVDAEAPRFAASLPEMDDEEMRFWMATGRCRRPTAFLDMHHHFHQTNGFKNNLIRE